MVETRDVVACKACYSGDGLVVEAVLNVHRRHPDGSLAEWSWDCPRCGAQVGFGMQGDRGALDLGVGYGETR